MLAWRSGGDTHSLSVFPGWSATMSRCWGRKACTQFQRMEQRSPPDTARAVARDRSGRPLPGFGFRPDAALRAGGRVEPGGLAARPSAAPAHHRSAGSSTSSCSGATSPVGASRSSRTTCSCGSPGPCSSRAWETWVGSVGGSCATGCPLYVVLGPLRPAARLRRPPAVRHPHHPPAALRRVDLGRRGAHRAPAAGVLPRRRPAHLGLPGHRHLPLALLHVVRAGRRAVGAGPQGASAASSACT